MRKSERRAAVQGAERESMLESNRRRESERLLAIQSSKSQLPLLQQDRVLQKIASFHAYISNCKFNCCNTCNESFPSLKISNSGECTRCARDKHQPKLFSSENGMEPGPVPPELQGLTQVEEMLLSAVMPMMVLYMLPHGQLSYSGHVVNLPQDVTGFASSLP